MPYCEKHYEEACMVEGPTLAQGRMSELGGISHLPPLYADHSLQMILQPGQQPDCNLMIDHEQRFPAKLCLYLTHSNCETINILF